MEQNIIRSYYVSMIHGGISDTGRMKAVNDFCNHGFSVMFMTVQTGGIGLNLQCDQRIVLLDPVYDNVEMKQLVGRCYRKGQEKDVYFYQFVIANTMDEYVFEKCMKKQILHDQLMSKTRPDVEEYHLSYKKLLSNNTSDLPDTVMREALTKYGCSPEKCTVVDLSHTITLKQTVSKNTQVARRNR